MPKVLIVDDSPSDIARFKALLTHYNFDVITAHDGDSGIKMATLESPDVILMDIVMPEMNGFQATRKLTRNEATSHIPVIIVSTKDQETDRVWGKRQGAKAYLTKPIDERELLQTLNTLLG